MEIDNERVIEINEYRLPTSFLFIISFEMNMSLLTKMSKKFLQYFDCWNNIKTLNVAPKCFQFHYIIREILKNFIITRKSENKKSICNIIWDVCFDLKFEQ